MTARRRSFRLFSHIPGTAANTLYEDSKDAQYAVPSLLKKMVTAGWLGKKSGKGFYEYK